MDSIEEEEVNESFGQLNFSGSHSSPRPHHQHQLHHSSPPKQASAKPSGEATMAAAHSAEPYTTTFRLPGSPPFPQVPNSHQPTLMSGAAHWITGRHDLGTWNSFEPVRMANISGRCQYRGTYLPVERIRRSSTFFHHVRSQRQKSRASCLTRLLSTGLG